MGRLARSREELLDIMHFTNLEMLDKVELCEKRSLSRGVFNFGVKLFNIISLINAF